MDGKLIVHRFIDRWFAENCYVVVGPSGTQALVIDPGLQAEQVVEGIERHGLTVETVVNTHGHIDHVAGNALVCEKTGAPLVAHAADLAMINDVPQQQRRLEKMGIRLDFDLPASPRPQMLLEEGKPFAFDGIAFDVIHTPGHSPGGVCLVHGETMFVGDTLFQGSIGRTDLPGGSMPDLVHSIREKLFRLPGSTLCWPGHGETTTLEEERRSNPFVSDRAVGQASRET